MTHARGSWHLAASSGCTTVYEGRYDVQDGWRNGN